MMLSWKKILSSTLPKNNKFAIHRCCPICEKNSTKTILTFENFQFFSDSDVSKQLSLHEVQCLQCGAIYLNPCYSDLGFQILFSEAGMSYGSTDTRPIEQLEWLKKQSLLNDGFHFIDVGCGIGNFLAALPKNIKKTGIDIDQSSINKAQNLHPDINFICSSFDKFILDGPIDVITMFHVLEHLPKPKETLKQLYTLANQSTRMIIEVPIIENGMTNDINGFFSAQHLTHFSRHSLRNILQSSGWTILQWDEQQDYNGCRVLVKKGTPSPILFNSTQEYTNVYEYLISWYQAINNAELKLNTIESHRCVIWGGGMHLEFLYQTTSLFSKAIEFIIIDSDPNKQNKTWRGIHIYPPNVIKMLKELDNITFIPSSYRGENSIISAMIDAGINPKQIIKLYDYTKVY